jgi:hypothetical protein
MSFKKLWALVFVAPLLVVAKARLLVWAVGLNWDVGFGQKTLTVASIIGGVLGTAAGIGTLVELGEKGFSEDKP